MRLSFNGSIILVQVEMSFAQVLSAWVSRVLSTGAEAGILSVDHEIYHQEVPSTFPLFGSQMCYFGCG